jgi:hypothetical protein
MSRWEQDKIKAAASTSSINKTLKDIDAILDGVRLPAGSGKREELRARIREALAETAVKWLREGFRGGHTTTARVTLDTGQIPLTLSRTIALQLHTSDEPTKITVRSELSAEAAELARQRQVEDPSSTESTT